MTRSPPFFGSLLFPERVGSVVLLAVLLFLGGTPIASLLSVAFLLVVPLGLSAMTASPGKFKSWGRSLILPCGSLAAVAQLVPAGDVAAAMVVPWGIVTLLLALGALSELGRLRRERHTMGDLAARLFIPIGGAWLVASRGGMTPLGFSEPIVSLTAIHFHFAGFAAPILAARGLERFGRHGIRRSLLTAALMGTVLGPLVLAAGFVVSPTLKLVAVTLIGLSLGTLASVTLISLREVDRLVSRILLTLSSLSLFAGITLAAIYATGEYTAKWWLLIDEMERTHGWLQGIGFSLLGLLAWRLEQPSRPEVFRIATPSPSDLREFAIAHRSAPFNYRRDELGGWWRNQGQFVIGHGEEVFARAKSSIMNLEMFPSWTKVGADSNTITVDSIVVTSARVLGLFSLNPCRVIEVLDQKNRGGFIYGTVEGHLMRGEERFEVRKEPNGEVIFEIESYSRPGHPISLLFAPLVRSIQQRFVADAPTELTRST